MTANGLYCNNDSVGYPANPREAQPFEADLPFGLNCQRRMDYTLNSQRIKSSC